MAGSVFNLEILVFFPLYGADELRHRIYTADIRNEGAESDNSDSANELGINICTDIRNCIPESENITQGRHWMRHNVYSNLPCPN